MDYSVGEGRPNPPTPFPPREGGAGKPLPSEGRGLGRGLFKPPQESITREK